MKMLVVGASGGTGALAARLALDRGHAVTAFARHPEALVLDHPQLTRFTGDFHDRASVEAAVAGHEAVIVTAAAGQLRAYKQNPNYFSQGTGHVIDAMKAQGVRRLVILSAFGVGESRGLASFLMEKLVISLVLRRPFEDHERQEQMVKASGLEWVIARPTRLTGGPARGRYVKTATLEKVPLSISRADVAAFLVEAAETESWVGKAVQLGG
jgi:uncharacterized protein YbjT (DUF2867 family)